MVPFFTQSVVSPVPGVETQLVETYGAFGIFLGAALEGETAVITGGYIAREGLVNPFVAAICAFLGSFLADQLVFLLGRTNREQKFVTKVRDKRAFTRALSFIESRPILFCLAFRFIYGMRIAAPLAIGFSKVRAPTFIALNALSAAAWACIFTVLGFRFGTRVLGIALAVLTNPIALRAVTCVIVVTLIWWLVRWRSGRLPA